MSSKSTSHNINTKHSVTFHNAMTNVLHNWRWWRWFNCLWWSGSAKLLFGCMEKNSASWIPTTWWLQMQEAGKRKWAEGNVSSLVSRWIGWDISFGDGDTIWRCQTATCSYCYEVPKLPWWHCAKAWERRCNVGYWKSEHFVGNNSWYCSQRQQMTYEETSSSSTLVYFDQTDLT